MTRLSPGSPVVLADEEGGWRGVVSQKNRETIAVAFSDWPELDLDANLRLNLSSDETTRKRQRTVLLAAQHAPKNRLGHLRDVLLGVREPRFKKVAPYAPNPRLNASQQAAIDHAIAADDVAIIHGPPGTGKTTAVAELIRRAAADGQKVLACAPSNLAVDNLVERLAKLRIRVVRLGHPARVLEELREYTLDFQAESHPEMKMVRKLFKDAEQLRDKSFKFTRARPLPGAKREMRDEAKSMIADARRIEDQIAAVILDGADVVCATLTGLDDNLIGDRRFEWCVIDEAGQATEATSWVPLTRAERVVLAGDPWQLPPTILSNEAQREGFGVSMLERLMKQQGERLARMLTVQYRMNAAIGQFSSTEFYSGELQPDASVKDHVLAELPGIIESEFTIAPLEFVDTAGAGYDEEPEPDGESRHNAQEAEIVRRRVMSLQESGLAPRDIAVITPYAAQAKFLRGLIDIEGLEIDTVDGFQGREKEAVIISLVRSNPRGEIGFLNDVRRMNVALTRARRKLIVIGDSATIGGHDFYERLLKYFEASGAYRTVWEEPAS